ncbi:ABC transporter permease [Candidatus Kaiserbacteria bacterium]|nr:ABC transporter permease [Candidatus Kaiserbacteria bacterium]USN88434.1 MAG: ABC transporter permease [Candidatus Nomurabacteria bacterium]
MVTAFRRVVKAGFVGFWRNAYVSLASIFVLTIGLFVIGATMFLNQLLQTSLMTLQSKVDINVYFVPDAPQEEIDRIMQAVEALPDVSGVTYTSREDALAKYRLENKDDTVAMQALEELNENPLGANIAVQAKQTSQYESIARFLDEQRELEQPQTPVIDEVNYNRNRDSIDRLTTIIGATERASLVVMGILLIAAILITFNTIRLAIYTSREEIAIMRLVGAGNMYIRGPFMLQGIMYGFISGVLALAFFYPMLIWLGPATAEFFGVDLYQYYILNFGEIFGVLVGIGIVLGLISSILAVARYLRT